MKSHKIVLATLATLISSHALAAAAVTGIVTAVRIDQTGNGLVHFDHIVSGTPPGCVIGAYQSALAFNTNTAAGKAIYAMVLAAKSQGSTITAYGLGTCAIFGSYIEDWDYGTVQ